MLNSAFGKMAQDTMYTNTLFTVDNKKANKMINNPLFRQEQNMIVLEKLYMKLFVVRKKYISTCQFKVLV